MSEIWLMREEVLDHCGELIKIAMQQRRFMYDFIRYIYS